eukprot:2177448-Karenia_brevis.AAC.1
MLMCPDGWIEVLRARAVEAQAVVATESPVAPAAAVAAPEPAPGTPALAVESPDAAPGAPAALRIEEYVGHRVNCI